MSHMVIFRTPEGKPGYQPAETVQDAVEVVERLRNDEGVENVRIFRLEELSFEYRPYYKVELAGAAAPTASHAPAVFGRPAVDEASADDEAVDEPEVEADEPIEASGSDVASEATAEHPPWAAPPPPPPGGASDRFDRPATGSVDDDDDDDDEFSGAGGQRRGLFGR